MKQGIHETSAVQLYPIGKRIAMGDDVFRYCYAAEILVPGSGAFNDGRRIYQSGGPVGGDAEYTEGVAGNAPGASALAEHLAGSILVNLDCARVVAKDGLAGGYLCRFVAPAFRCRIKSNLATNGAGIIAITLADPLPVDVSAGEWIIAYPNIYSSVLNTGIGAPGGVAVDDVRMAVVCVPLIAVPAERYFWGQTWGPIVPGAGHYANLVGRTYGKRKVFFDGIGSMVYHGTINALDTHWQEAGDLLFDGFELYYGDQLVMLKLAP